MRPMPHPATATPIAADREVDRRLALQRRGLALNTLTLGYNLVEAVLALAFGAAAGSVALIGFGI
ncbi:MAG TPA: hypothetical protein PKE51_11220, partial [Gemmatimonadaceae bacterium]|nr:hypothetical protein [Gemmatimonadaceae bacterium]